MTVPSFSLDEIKDIIIQSTQPRFVFYAKDFVDKYGMDLRQVLIAMQELKKDGLIQELCGRTIQIEQQKKIKRNVMK